jgi:hypothetical protein
VFDAAGACPAAGCGRATCQWEEQTVQPLDAPTVARTRTAAQDEGKKLARKLQIRQWLAAQVRVRRTAGRASRAGAAEGSVEERWAGEDYWIGRAADGGCGKGPIVKEFERTEMSEGTRYTAGDIAIAVEWHDRVASDLEGMRFKRGTTLATAAPPMRA